MSPLRAQPLIVLGLLSLIVLGSTAALFTYQLPNLQSKRVKLDQVRTNLLALEYQQKNLESVRRQLTDVQTYQKQLDGYVWSFAKEEAFFTAWEKFDQQLPVKTSALSLTDAVPTDQLLTRTGSVALTGSPDDVLEAISRIQAFQPAIGLTAVHLTSSLSRSLDAAVEFSTIWR